MMEIPVYSNSDLDEVYNERRDDVNYWLKAYRTVPDMYITALFPHACPDGMSDELVQLLYGDSRCSPKKRISKSQM